MSWSLVTGQTAFFVNTIAGQVASLSVTFPGSVTAGNLVLCGINSYYETLAHISNVRDQINNVNYVLAYRNDNPVTTIRSNLALYYYQPPVGGVLTVTVTFALNDYPSMWVAEFGLTSGNLVSVPSVNKVNDTIDAVTCGTVTPTGSDLIIGAVACNYPTATYTADSGMTQIYSTPGSSGKGIGGSAEYLLNTSSSYNPSFTCSLGGSGWSSLAAVFHESPLSGTSRIRRLICTGND